MKTEIRTYDGLNLTAELMPAKGSPRDLALVLLPGGFNCDQEGDISGPIVGHGFQGQPAQLSLQLAEALSRAGIATLRYAKRGFEDPNEIPNQVPHTLALDAYQAFRRLRELCPETRVGYAGFSEGALLALLAAREEKPDALFLFAPPARRFDEVLAFQYLEWPVELIRRRLDLDGDGVVSLADAEEIAANPPLLQRSWSELARADGTLSIAEDLVPAYLANLQGVTAFIRGGELRRWYDAWMELPTLSSLLGDLPASTFVYQAMEDAHMRWSWAIGAFEGRAKVRVFDSLGHCFAPMEGTLGEKRTSGPFDERVIEKLVEDAKGA